MPDSGVDIKPISHATYHLNVGTKLRQEWDIDSALVHLYKARAMFLEEGNKAQATLALKQIGTALCMNGDLDEGRTLLEEAAEDFLSQNEVKNYAKTIGNIGSSYSDDGKYALAIRYHKMALNSLIEHRLSDELESIPSNLVAAFMEWGQMDSAWHYANVALKYSTSETAKGYVGSLYSNMSAYYLRNDVYDSSMHYATLALDISKSTKNYRAMESSMDNIIATFYSQELYKEAADALFSLNELKDSISVIKNNERIQELALQYNLEQNHLRLEQAESANSLKSIILALVLTLAIGIIATLIIVFRMRKKRLIAIADAIYRGRKVEHKRVADLLVNDINEEIKHASQLFISDPSRAQELLIDSEAKILRLANLNYSQAMEDHGIRGALEALAQSIKEDSGIDVHTRINLLDPLDREQEEDVFELSEKLLVHIVRFNETDLIHFEMESRDGHYTITMKRKTEHASRRSSMYENLEFTVAHLSGEMVNQLDANGLTVTTIHV